MLCCTWLHYAYAGPVVNNVNMTLALIDSVQGIIESIRAGVCLCGSMMMFAKWKRDQGEGRRTGILSSGFAVQFPFSPFPLMHFIG